MAFTGLSRSATLSRASLEVKVRDSTSPAVSTSFAAVWSGVFLRAGTLGERFEACREVLGGAALPDFGGLLDRGLTWAWTHCLTIDLTQVLALPMRNCGALLGSIERALFDTRPHLAPTTRELLSNLDRDVSNLFGYLCHIATTQGPWSAEEPTKVGFRVAESSVTGLLGETELHPGYRGMWRHGHPAFAQMLIDICSFLRTGNFAPIEFDGGGTRNALGASIVGPLIPLVLSRNVLNAFRESNDDAVFRGISLVLLAWTIDRFDPLLLPAILVPLLFGASELRSRNARVANSLFENATNIHRELSLRLRVTAEQEKAIWNAAVARTNMVDRSFSLDPHEEPTPVVFIPKYGPVNGNAPTSEDSPAPSAGVATKLLPSNRRYGLISAKEFAVYEAEHPQGALQTRLRESGLEPLRDYPECLKLLHEGMLLRCFKAAQWCLEGNRGIGDRRLGILYLHIVADEAPFTSAMLFASHLPHRAAEILSRIKDSRDVDLASLAGAPTVLVSDELRAISDEAHRELDRRVGIDSGPARSRTAPRQPTQSQRELSSGTTLDGPGFPSPRPGGGSRWLVWVPLGFIIALTVLVFAVPKRADTSPMNEPKKKSGNDSGAVERAANARVDAHPVPSAQPRSQVPQMPSTPTSSVAIAVAVTKSKQFWATSVRRSWEGALADCTQRKMALAAIATAEEQAAIDEISSTLRASLWLGARATYKNHKRRFAWSTGAKWSYERWQPGDPNGPKREECIATCPPDFQSAGCGAAGWADVPCSALFGYACERPR